MKARHDGFTSDADYESYLRKYFAAMAMQGILAANEKIEYGDYGRKRQMTPSEVAIDARYNADALITELNKEQKP